MSSIQPAPSRPKWDAESSPPRASSSPEPGPAGRRRELALRFAHEILARQGVPALGAPAAARALALLLERSGAGPVVLSGVEAARVCGFEPRTWWLVRRRLLGLGHLVASAGGQAPRGSQGGRGRKASYLVAPPTLEQFRAFERGESPALPSEAGAPLTPVTPASLTPASLTSLMPASLMTGKTLMPRKTLNVLPPVTVRGTGVSTPSLMSTSPSLEESDRSQHRSTFVSSKKITSDVLKFFEDARNEESPVERSAAETASATGTIERGPDRGNDGGNDRGNDGVNEGGNDRSENRERSLPRNSECPPASTGNVPGSPVTARDVLDLVAGERSVRVRLTLLRLAERLVLLERLERTADREERLALLATVRRGTRTFRRGTRTFRRGTRASRSPGQAISDFEIGPILADPPEPSASGERSGNSARNDKASSPCPSGDSLPESSPSEAPVVPGGRAPRRPRAALPLWSPDANPEARAVFAQVHSILEWANREFAGTFSVERSARDTLRYPFEVVRNAVSNVLLKRAQGYPFENPGAVLWEGITLPGYRLAEFACARFEEVLARIGADASRPAPSASARPGDVRPPPAGGTLEGQSPPKREQAPSFEVERQRRERLQRLYESLPQATRSAIDEAAKEIARRETPGAATSPLGASILARRALEARNALLEKEYAPKGPNPFSSTKDPNLEERPTDET